MMLKESIVVASRNPVGHGAAYSIRAAELGGAIIGICGPEIVAELLTQNLALFVPVISSSIQAQMVAHFTWSACRISQIFKIEQAQIPHYYSSVVGAAQVHCFRFFTEVLEFQCRGPAPVLALPITFFYLAASEPSIVEKFGSIPRIAGILKKFHSSSICTCLFNYDSPAGRSAAFQFYNTAI